MIAVLRSPYYICTLNAYNRVQQKLLLGIIFTLLLVTSSRAQEEQRFRVGLTAGLLTSGIPGTGANSHKAGFTGGLLVNTSLKKSRILQMEINYIQKGASQFPDSANTNYFKYVFNYLEVPVLIRRRLHFTMFKKPTSSFELEAGASFGRLITYSYTGSTNYLQYLDPSTLNKTDISLLVGLNYIITPNLYLCLRYSNSVIPVLKHDGAITSSNLVYTFNAGNNVDFQITLKYVFSFPGFQNEEKAQ